MKRFVILTLMAASALKADILKQLECHDKVVHEGMSNLVFAAQIQSMFKRTNVDHFISNFNSTNRAVWNSVAYFHGRYRMSMRSPIKIDHGKCRFGGAIGAPQFVINEVEKVEDMKLGRVMATMENQWKFGEDEWNRLVQNGGDWSSVRIVILTNSPVAGFEKWAQKSRNSIDDRKKTFDETLRKARHPRPWRTYSSTEFLLSGNIFLLWSAESTCVVRK